MVPLILFEPQGPDYQITQFCQLEAVWQTPGNRITVKVHSSQANFTALQGLTGHVLTGDGV